jgi:L-ascorbate metabolism protein UlaG (beta-lactamase superfamily)
LPQNLHAVFLPINGKGNNMNAEDAVRFAMKTGAKYSVPVHFGMFDSLDPTVFLAENRVIPTVYEPVFKEEEK